MDGFTPDHIQADDLLLISRMKGGEQAAFNQIYNRYWDKLFGYVYNRMDEREQAEEIVQDVFLMLWERREAIVVDRSLASFLFTATKRRMLNVMRGRKVRKKYADDLTVFLATRYDNSNEESLLFKDLEEQIEKSLSELPEHYGKVYRLSRKEHIPTPEIAAKMNISPKTAENYLSFALSHLRSALGGIVLSVVIVLRVLIG